MDYFSILNLRKEPFSNSPDPEFFFHSRQHLDCLQKLELSLLLRRGLNVIIGDVGSGKTTLCRQLIRRFAQKEEMETHLILDPHFLNASEFLGTVTKMLIGKKPPVGSHDWQVKEHIKQHLFRKGVDQNKTIVLIIDEGQKIPPFCLEILREFLNYETNEYKLLQIVIFAQKEFENKIRKYHNFADRISLYHLLKPLSFYDTRLMIKYRLEKSSSSHKKLNLFTYPALWAIYRISGGYPRKIINLCHQSILSMIIQNRSKATYFLVSACARRVFPEESRRKKIIRTAAVTAGAAAVILLVLLASDRLKTLPTKGIQSIKSAISQNRNPEADALHPEAKAPTFRAQIAPTDFHKQTQTDTELQAKPQVKAEGPVETEKPINTDDPVKAEESSIVKEPVKTEDKIQVAVTKDTASPDANIRSSPPGLTYSTILGQITLKRNENLSEIIQRVYGGFNSRNFKLFILANPDIDDPDQVEIGQIISVPAIPAKVAPLDKPVWWVKVNETDMLENAFDILRKHSDNSLPVRLIAYWAPASGTKFVVVLNKLFKNEQSARSQLKELPTELSSNASILSKWSKENVYFVDPYFGRKQ